MATENHSKLQNNVRIRLLKKNNFSVKLLVNTLDSPAASASEAKVFGAF